VAVDRVEDVGQVLSTPRGSWCPVVANHRGRCTELESRAIDSQSVIGFVILLGWRVGLGPAAAREKVRVAEALGQPTRSTRRWRARR